LWRQGRKRIESRITDHELRITNPDEESSRPTFALALALAFPPRRYPLAFALALAFALSQRTCPCAGRPLLPRRPQSAIRLSRPSASHQKQKTSTAVESGGLFVHCPASTDAPSTSIVWRMGQAGGRFGGKEADIGIQTPTGFRAGKRYLPLRCRGGWGPSPTYPSTPDRFFPPVTRSLSPLPSPTSSPRMLLSRCPKIRFSCRRTSGRANSPSSGTGSR
jgi:hypothetical protein